jgi:hypothetical protein
MTTPMIIRLTTIMLAVSAAAVTAQAQTSTTGQAVKPDTRTAAQFDDYNPSIKPSPWGYDAGGGSANKSDTEQYKQGAAQSLPDTAKQDKY